MLEEVALILRSVSRMVKARCIRKVILIVLFATMLLVWFEFHVPVSKSNFTDNFTDSPQTSMQFVNSSADSPGKHLSSLRFDVIIKLVYAYYYVTHNFVPDVFTNAYREHLNVWNNFKESCRNLHPNTFDATLSCENKSDENDFVLSFHNTIESIREHGFQSGTSQIPTDKNGVIFNGAHRLAAATILSKKVTFEYFNTTTVNKWNYLYFENKGLQRSTSDLIMLEWMKLQLKLPQVSTKVFIISIFSDDQDKVKIARKIVAQNCSRDNGILYERTIRVNKLGMSQLLRHMYGNQVWLPIKIQEMLSLFKGQEFTIVFLFFFGRSVDEMLKCKYKVRTLYNHQSFKSSAHIPDSPEESLILAEMVLNPNSIQFLNYGENGIDCLGIAKELAARSSMEPVPTLPGIYLGREDLMFDSGSVMHVFNLRKRTDVDILFLHDIDTRTLGDRNGFNIEAHAFKENTVDQGRPWGEDHFSGNVKSKWDLFYDGNNFGFCYGIRFVSLEQLIRYKSKRNEPVKDKNDIGLIAEFLRIHHLQNYYQLSMWDRLKMMIGF